MLNVQSYQKPADLTAALQLLKKGTYKAIAGGTDLLPQLRAGAHAGVNLVDLQALSGVLGQIRLEGDYLSIGGLCTHHQIEHDPLVRQWCRPLADACGKIGSAQIRKRATIAGNLINASPAADSAPVLAACGAQAVLCDWGGSRTVPVPALACRPGMTCLRPAELLTQLRIPLSGGAWTGSYQKLGARNALLIAVASVAILEHPMFGVRISCGSVGPTVCLAYCCERIYARRNQSREAFYDALREDIQPISDVRASAGYRMEVLANLIYQSYLQKEAQRDDK